MSDNQDDTRFYENLGVPESEKANSCEFVHEQEEKNTKVLMAMMIGRKTDVQGIEFHHMLPTFKSYKGHAKEIKPELKHLKAEILCRYRACGSACNWKEPRPAQWTNQKCVDWLKSHFICDQKDSNLVIMIADYH